MSYFKKLCFFYLFAKLLAQLSPKESYEVYINALIEWTALIILLLPLLSKDSYFADYESWQQRLEEFLDRSSGMVYEEDGVVLPKPPDAQEADRLTGEVLAELQSEYEAEREQKESSGKEKGEEEEISEDGIREVNSSEEENNEENSNKEKSSEAENGEVDSSEAESIWGVEESEKAWEAEKN